MLRHLLGASSQPRIVSCRADASSGMLYDSQGGRGASSGHSVPQLFRASGSHGAERSNAGTKLVKSGHSLFGAYLK